MARFPVHSPLRGRWTLSHGPVWCFLRSGCLGYLGVLSGGSFCHGECHCLSEVLSVLLGCALVCARKKGMCCLRGCPLSLPAGPEALFPPGLLATNITVTLGTPICEPGATAAAGQPEADSCFPLTQLCRRELLSRLTYSLRTGGGVTVCIDFKYVIYRVCTLHADLTCVTLKW